MCCQIEEQKLCQTIFGERSHNHDNQQFGHQLPFDLPSNQEPVQVITSDIIN